MDRKTTGIVATIVAVLLCGCPGLFALCLGAAFSVASQVPGAVDAFSSGEPERAQTYSVVMLLGGLVLVAIPIIVGFLLLRNQPVSASGATIDMPAAPPPSYPSYPPEPSAQPVEPPPVEPAEIELPAVDSPEPELPPVEPFEPETPPKAPLGPESPVPPVPPPQPPPDEEEIPPAI